MAATGGKILGKTVKYSDEVVDTGKSIKKTAGGTGNVYYHSTSPSAVKPIMENGFRTDIPNPVDAFHNNRFGRGVYVSDTPNAALAERPGGTVLKVEANIGKNLDITNRGVIDPDMGKAIARGARKHGYDSITTISAQSGGGINTIIFDPNKVRVVEVFQ